MRHLGKTAHLPVIPGLDPGTSFQEVNGWHPDFRLKSSRQPPPGGTRIKSGYDGKGREHCRSGAGYEFLADQVLTLNRLNPQVASRMVKLFARWRKYDDQRQASMRAQLERIVGAPVLSPDVFEIASKSLQAS